MPESAPEILLVEDNPDDVELTLHAFRKYRLANRVHVVRDGQEALDRLLGDGDAAGPLPKVVLLDLNLPKVHGLEVLRRLRADPRTALIPVVVLTTSALDRDLEESYRLGANSYIVKPVDFQRFVEVCRVLGLYWLLYNTPPKA
ncbi:response regulator [Dissulfurirhabdus thermomarina]|uniref:Response regulator n=1 Tax=Dissulfurirhabdus thermomarina TaxID=1765737 RepID=A0A6N9TJS8_DISTH|nr:response regulator [Dissulfurirhabdus thermomarina]NDY41505.1 response regulator [Dissulfurirhabdus thermomarina]NMX23868.1 response regulator [Dissulfurirhabdus thermomarina]